MGIIAIVGLGPSKHLFKNDLTKFDKTIGVNDIWRFHETDVIVCLDHPTGFTPDRLKVINNSKPEAFYSQAVIWDTRDDFVQIKIRQGYPESICILEPYLMAKSYFSPFVACQVGFWYYGATELHLFGIDMTNHPHLNGDLCRKLKGHFRHLKTALGAKGCQVIVHGNGILT